MLYLYYYSRPPDKNVFWKNIILISHPKHIPSQRDGSFDLNETVLLSTQNTCLN